MKTWVFILSTFLLGFAIVTANGNALILAVGVGLILIYLFNYVFSEEGMGVG